MNSLIDEVRKARPLSSADIVNETWFGSARNPLDTNTGSSAPQLSPTVTILRLEW